MNRFETSRDSQSILHRLVDGRIVLCVMLFVAFVMLFVAGCGDSSNETNNASNPNPNPGATPAPPPPSAPGTSASTPPAPPPASAASAAPEESASSSAASTSSPAVRVRPTARKQLQWGPEKIKFVLPASTKLGPTVFAPSPSTCAMVAGSLRNLLSGESLSNIALPPEEGYRLSRALSPDGKAYAVSVENERHKPLSIRLIATSTGKEIHQLQLPQINEKYPSEVKYMAFLANRTLLVIGSSVGDEFVVLYNITKGKPTKQFPLEHANDDYTAVSPTGDHMITGDSQNISIYDLKSGRPIAKLVVPQLDNGLDRALSGFIGIRQLAFSPSGKEIACQAGKSVVCWDLSGSIVFQEQCINKEGSLDEGLVWIPDGSGWLVNNRYLLRRESKSVPWEVRTDRGKCQFLDQDSLAILDGYSGDEELKILPVPWETIQQFDDLIKSDTPTLLKPGDSVALQFEIGEIRCITTQEAQQQLVEKLSAYLAVSGFQVADNSPLVMTVKYSEKAGETREVVERGRLSIGRGRPTGVKLQETICTIHAKLDLEGHPTTLWKFDYNSGRTFTVYDDATDAGLRKQSFNLTFRMLDHTSLPFWIPKDPTLPSFPLVTKLGR